MILKDNGIYGGPTLPNGYEGNDNPKEFLITEVNWMYGNGVNLNNYFELSYSVYFLSQFLIYSIIYLIIFRKNYFYVPLSLPLVFLYLISVVAFIDRSLTVEMMIYYLNNPNTNYLDLFEIEKLTTDYLIEKRINEQLNTGLINLANNEINLSYRGKVFANIYKVLSSFYK